MLYERLWPQGALVLVALSGGGDSMALLELLLDAGERVEAAHLDHGWRAESAGEAEHLQAICRARGVTLHRRRVDVAARAARWGCGLEAAGRRSRYAWLRRLARERGAVVCTGHTRDDQAETLLMRLVQGCSVRALRGIRARRGDWLFRPLLGCAGAELRAYLRERATPWLEDPTNADTAHLRNWVRHRVLPLLRERNPRIEESLARLAAGTRFDDVAALWRSVDPSARLTFYHLERLAALGVGKRCTLPGGLTAFREHSALRIYRELPSTPAAPAPVVLVGRTRCEEWGLIVEVGAEEEGEWSVRVPPDRSLLLRGRREGDRFGKARLKKIFNELKIEPRLRAAWPLLVDGDNRVLALVGTPRKLVASGPLVVVTRISPST